MKDQKGSQIGSVAEAQHHHEVCSYGENGKSFGCNRRGLKTVVTLVGLLVACLVLFNAVNPYRLIPSSFYPKFGPRTLSPGFEYIELQKVLQKASMKDKTVVLTTLNDAWAEPNSIFDLFLESFKIGNNTKGFLKHLVVICFDQKAYDRCLAIHRHCYQLKPKTGANFTEEAFFMSQDYLEMMWTRIDFLSSILQLGYSFLFTDTDIMWFRDPFPRFHQDADFQIACDYFNKNSYDLHNQPNGGFTYVRSNNRTIQFYKFWYFSRKVYPHMHDQDVLNKIKFDPFITNIGIKIRFLDTAYFGGFCQPSRDFNQVCTMHANCCVGLDNKINDLSILLNDWRNYMSLRPNTNSHSSWHVPQNCSTSFDRMRKHKSGNNR
ncbi:hypothetical protein UlMin_008958 [Ulmus minor]